ncbi:MAG: signal peptidase I [Candidatus Izemoplasmatales bacterium]
MEYEANDIINEQQKLMKKSLLLIISFFLFFILDVILFIVFQNNKLFMFNLNRSEENMPNPFLSDIFATIFYSIIIIALIVYIVFIYICLSKQHKTNHQLIKKIQSFADFFSIVPIFLFIVIMVNGLFVTIGQVDGDSMKPTFCSYDSVIIIYNSDIETNDILIMQYDDSFLIKRVIGLPGDKLVVNESGVFINDVLIEIYTPLNSIEYDTVIPNGQYYVMGDNRYNSLDSRVIGLFSEELILGEVKYNITNGNCD